VAVKLSKTYGSSIYSAVRRYVVHDWPACTVVVLKPPVFVEGDRFRAEVRRHCSSPKFIEFFGEIEWLEFVTPDHALGKLVPLAGRKMTGKRSMSLIDRNGHTQDYLAEAFTQKHHVFIFIQR
jgi:hypothetical protein